MKRAASWALGMALAMASMDARALLTTSEQAQVDSFVAEAKVASAPRVRALVARPDLSTDEATTALAHALVMTPFTEARAAYLREMLFGGASQASRPILAVVVTRAVIARADALLAKYNDLDAQSAVLAELLRIYAFLDVDIANARASGGIPASSYDDATKALAEHVSKNPRWLKADAPIAGSVVAVRAQAQLALYDMMNEGPARRVDAADKLGMAGARRAMLTESGMLLLDAAKADAAKVDRVRALVARFPAARGEVEAIYFGEGPLRARGDVLTIKTPLEASNGDGPALFPDEVDGPTIDASLGEVARALANVAVKRALETRPQLLAQAEKDVRAAGADPKKRMGTPADASTSAAIAACAQLLALDAPRALDLAMVRLLANHPESAAVLSDALGALAAYAPSTTSQSGVAVPLGKAKNDGTSETLAATNVALAPAGFATSFALAGHTWSFARDDAGAISAKRDGAAMTFAMLPGARLPLTDATMWSAGGLVFARMQGLPRAGVAAGHVRVAGTGAKLDAIATAAPGDDVVVEGEMTAKGEVAIALRAIAGREAFKGVALVIAPANGVMRASLRALDESGRDVELAAPVDVTVPAHVKMSVKGTKLEATLGTATWKATVPASFAHGDVALAAKRGGSLEITEWAVRKP